MTRIDFFLLLTDNFSIYLLSLILVGIALYPMIKKLCRGVIDPLFYALIGCVFASAVPIFLYIEGYISNYYFFYFIITESLLLINFYIGYKIKIKSQKFYIRNDYKKSTIIFYIFFILLISLFFIQLVFFGFGAFSGERLGVFKDSGGWGIIIKIGTFICTFNIFYAFFVLDKSNNISLKERFFGISALLISCIYIFLQGAKSGLFQILFIFFYYYVIDRQRHIPKKTRNYLIGIAACGMLAMFAIKSSSENISNTFLSVSERMVVNGDVYWYAFPNDQIEQIHPAKWTDDLFRPFIYSLRLKNRDEAIPGIGTQLVYQVYPNRIGQLIGANSRPSVWGYAMFGSYGWVFTIVWGFVLGRLCNISICNFPKGIIGSVFGYTIFSSALAGLADPQLTFMFLFDGLIGFGLIITIIIFYELLRKIHYEAI